MRQYFAVQQAQGERTADLYIFGDIVPFEWFDGDTSGDGLRRQLEALDADTIRVHIDSYGGAVSEGWAIYNALRQHPAKIITYGDGFVASAALYPFLAGDERYASTLSAYFFHQVMTGAEGYADDLRAAADEADKLTEIGVQAFVERAGMDADRVRELMAGETWLTPQEALELGLATAVIQDETPKAQQSIRRQLLQRVTAREPEKREPEKREPEKNGLMQLLSRAL